MTPEAHAALRAYLKFRAKNGEDVGPGSTLIVQRYKTKRGSPMKLKPLPITGRGVRRLIEGSLRSHKIRTGTKRRHEFKVAHGFRKLFKTRAQVAMKPIHVEMLMGHNVGLEASYYKPSENELMEDYLKAIPSSRSPRSSNSQSPSRNWPRRSSRRPRISRTWSCT
jgi:hypothetical protein